MKEILIEILEQFCPNNVYLQGTLNEETDYPQKFCTFFVSTTEDNGFYDDVVVSFDWHFSVMFYSDDPAEVNTIPQQIRAALKNAGFIPQGKGNDILSGKPTHTGWATDYIINERENKQ